MAGNGLPRVQSIDSQTHRCLEITRLRKMPFWAFPTPEYWGPLSLTKAGPGIAGQVNCGKPKGSHGVSMLHQHEDRIREYPGHSVSKAAIAWLQLTDDT